MPWCVFRDYVTGLLYTDSRLARRVHELTKPQGGDENGG